MSHRSKIIERITQMSYVPQILQLRHHNRIWSNNTSVRSIQGHHITVMPDTIIDYYSSINSYTYIGNRCSITKTTIGRYVSIANNVTIGPGEHDLTQISTSNFFCQDAYAALTQKPCTIGNDVWIGVDSIIRRGVTIGNGAVIGANSFVSTDIPDFAIAVGSPARVIKYRFTEAQRNLISQSNWWNLDLADARPLIQEIQAKSNSIPFELPRA
jgi:virginiamycin A acetyltransferase